MTSSQSQESIETPVQTHSLQKSGLCGGAAASPNGEFGSTCKGGFDYGGQVGHNRINLRRGHQPPILSTGEVLGVPHYTHRVWV